MTISCTFANPEGNQVLFTDNRSDTYVVPVSWPGRFRDQDNDGGGVVGFLANGGTIVAYVAPDMAGGARENSAALDARRREAKKDEIDGLINQGDALGAVKLMRDLLP